MTTTDTIEMPVTQRLDAHVLRLGLAIMFLAHAYLKPFVHGFEWMAEFFTTVGLPPFLVYVAFALELAAGVLLLVNRYVLVVCIVMLPEMLIATSVHLPNGWLFAMPGGGWEYPAFLCVALVVLAIQTYQSKPNVFPAGIIRGVLGRS